MESNKFSNIFSKESFKDFVFGFQDGLISTYVLLAGIAILVIFNPTMLIIALMAEISAGAISMAFGAYIATKTENESLDIPDNHNSNDESLIKYLFAKNEVSEREIQITEAFFHEHPDIYAKLSIKKPKPTMKDPADNAIRMGLAFVIGGILPLAPYIIPIPTWSFIIATILSFSGLFTIGIFRHHIVKSKSHWIKPALEMVLLGILAVIIISAYLYFISLFYGIIIY